MDGGDDIHFKEFDCQYLALIVESHASQRSVRDMRENGL